MSGDDIRLIIADDQVLVREGIRAILESEVGMTIVGLAANGQEAIDLVERIPCDLVLLDIRMPQLNGINTCQRLKDKYPDLPVAMLTNFVDEEEVVGAIRAGANGYLLKDLPADDLVSALRRLVLGEPVVSHLALQTIFETIRQPTNVQQQQLENAQLTSREEQILQAIILGENNGMIADQFGLAEGTVRNHVSRIYEKLGVRDRIEVIMLARRHGWFSTATM